MFEAIGHKKGAVALISAQLLFKSSFYGLAHYNFDCMCCTVAKYRKNIAFDGISVNGYTLDAFADMIRIGNLDIIGCATELAGS